jgi:hypothetical protein
LFKEAEIILIGLKGVNGAASAVVTEGRKHSNMRPDINDDVARLERLVSQFILIPGNDRGDDIVELKLVAPMHGSKQTELWRTGSRALSGPSPAKQNRRDDHTRNARRRSRQKYGVVGHAGV